MRVVIITGASSGIGAALARELARRGWKVGVVARRQELLDTLVQDIVTAGGQAAAAAADVTDQAGLYAAIHGLEASLGPCDLLVANAGTGYPTPAYKVPIEGIIAIMRLNFDGAVYAVGAVLPGMLERKAGRLAVMSSVASTRGLPRTGAYSASKAAVTALWESMRIDLRKTGVRCTTIHPGFVATELTAKNRFAMPFLVPVDKAARICADGLEAGAVDITFPWQMRWLSRLMRRIPNWLWDRIVPGQ